MFPSRGEADRKMLPPISSLSSLDSEFAGESRPTTPGGRPPLREEPGRERRPPSAMDHRRSPPAGALARLPPSGSFARPDEKTYGPPMTSKFVPPHSFRDLDRGSPISEEAWRSYDQQSDSRFGTKDPYSPRMPPAPYAVKNGPPSWQRPDDAHRSRMAAPPAMRDEGAWRPASQSQPEQYTRERAMEEERWRDERGARPGYYEHGPPPYPQDPRAGRPLDVDPEEARRVRARATSSLMDDESRYPPVSARPYPAGPYSPPEPRRHSAAPSQQSLRTMAGMEPTRPNTTHGAPLTSSASSAPTPPTTVNANRRVAHLLSEQKRRESINTGFEDLRQAIPACRDGQDSKATILKRALEYIRELEGVVDRQHRMPMESHPLSYGHRSPPDDKDDLRRFGRGAGDEERRAAGQMAGGSSSGSSEAATGPRVGGLPSNAFGNGSIQGYPVAHPREYRPYGSPHMPPSAHANPTEAIRAPVASPAIKRWAEDSDEDHRSPSRRRVSDGDKEAQGSPAGPNYLAAPHPPSVRPRSPLIHSPTVGRSRDWHPRMETRVDSAVRV